MNSTKDKTIFRSPEAKVLSGVMILQYAVMWLVQRIDEHFYMYQEVFLTIVLIFIAVSFVLRLYRTYKSGNDIKALFNKPSLVDICLLLLAVWACITTITAVDPSLALSGKDFRFEGLYALLSYYILCWYATRVTEEDDRKKLIWVFEAIGIVSAIVGILEGFGPLAFLSKRWGAKAVVPYGNINFFGSMMSMVSAVGIGLFIFGKDKHSRWSGLFTYIVSVAAIFCCDSSSPIVGNIMTFFMVLFIGIATAKTVKRNETSWFDRPFSKLLVLIILYFLIALGVNSARNGSVAQEINQDIGYADEGLTSDKMFSHRMGVWKYSFEVLGDWWLFGTGPDNFQAITNAEKAPASMKYYDKAHNEYINLMIQEGVPAIVVYLIFLFALFIPTILWLFKDHCGCPIYMSIFLAFFAYIAQAFFNISVIEVAPYFWIVCGLLAAEIKRTQSVNC